MVLKAIRDFLRLESASGLLLLLAAAAAMTIVNSPAKPLYDALLDTAVEVRVGQFEIAKPLLLWVNDGLMAVFFFLIGLEVKREVLRGELSEPARVVLPVIAAAGGMMVPALIYASINWGDDVALRGWAIPCATDIAFALAVLALLGSRVSHGLKLFLLTLAIADDLGAIAIIAVFYTANLSALSLWVAAGAMAILYVMNRRGVLNIAPYLIVGLVLWTAVLKSGVHATLAGVLLAFFIPLRVSSAVTVSPLEQLERDLHPAVAYGILPVFAFMNTGVSLQGLSVLSLMEPVPLGIALGLFIGNQVGVFGFCLAAVKLGGARLPEGVGWLQMYGVSLLCGIGFTMSLFISSLAFEQGGTGLAVDDRLGILCGSITSAAAGFLVLRLARSGNHGSRDASEP
jgi:NhaA family Na+:H+ antiporter